MAGADDKAGPNGEPELTETQLIACTGGQLYVYSSASGVYAAVEAPKQPVATGRDLPEPFGDLLSGQNPSLLLALSDDPLAEFLDGVKEVHKLPDATEGGRSFVALKLTG